MRIIDEQGDTDLYCRLSREQGDKVGTVELQERNLLKECKRLGLRARAVHVDDGISAWDREKIRPGYLELLASMKRGDCRNIMAVDLDRFSRQTGEWDALLYLALKQGVHIFARGAEIDASSPMQKAMAGIMGVLGDLESTVKAGKIRDTHQEIADQRRFHGGPRPFGYEDDGITPHADEAPLYRELIHRVCEGEVPGLIARDWQERGLAQRNGKAYNVTALRGLVFSPRHSGQAVRRGKVTGKAVWPGLVTIEEQARAQAMFRSRLVARAPRGTGDAALSEGPLLQGIARCALCGTKLVLNRRRGQNYLRCPSTGGDACGGVLVNARLADSEVETRFMVRLAQPKVQRDLARQQAAAPEIGALLERIDKLDADLAMVAEMKRADEIDRDFYRREVRELTAAKKAAEADLASSTLPAAITTDPETLIEKWETLLVAERRANLMAVAESVTIGKHIGSNRKVWNGERVSVEWKNAQDA